jgi:hypothetical protein
MPEPISDTSVVADNAADTTVNDDTSVADDDAEDALNEIEVDEADIALEAPDDEEEASADSDDSEEEADVVDDADEEEAAADEADKPALTDEEKQKAANNEAAQARIRAREARIARVKQDQSAYVEEARANNDPLEIAVRELQVANYNSTVDANQNKLTNGYNKALADFPVLSTKDPVIQKEIDDAIDAFQAQHVKIDAYGNPADVRGDLYVTLQAKAESIEKLTGIRATNQAKSKGKEKSKTLVTPQRQPKTPKKDPDLDAFDQEAYGDDS